MTVLFEPQFGKERVGERNRKTEGMMNIQLHVGGYRELRTASCSVLERQGFLFRLLVCWFVSFFLSFKEKYLAPHWKFIYA
jgi:hypothetical protein